MLSVKKIKDFVSTWIQKNKLPKDLTNISILISGTSIAQAIPFLGTPFIARLYTSDAFGELALFASIGLFMSILSSGNFHQAIILPKEHTVAKQLFMLVQILTLLLAIIVIFFGIFFQEKLMTINSFIQPYWFYFLPIFMLAYNLKSSLVNLFNRQVKFKEITYCEISKSSLSVSTKLILGLGTNSGLGLILGTVTSFIGCIAISLYFVKDKLRSFFSFPTSLILETVKNFKDFPLFNMPRSLTNTLSSSLPVFILSFYFSKSVVGNYSMAIALSFIPIQVVRDSVYQVFFEKINRMRNNQIPIYTQVQRLCFILFCTAIIPFTLIYIFTPTLVTIIIGEQWIYVSDIIRRLLPWLIVLFCTTPISFIPKISNHLKEEFYFDLIYLIVRILSLYIGIAKNDVLLAIFLFSLSGFLFKILFMIWYFHLAKGIDKLKSVC